MDGDHVYLNCVISISLDFKDYKVIDVRHSFRGILATLRGASLPVKRLFVKCYLQSVCYVTL